MSKKCCSGTGKEGKTKEVVEDREAKKGLCDKVVCERWCVCDKIVCERWCVCVCVKVVCERERVTKLRVKDGV